MTLDARATSEVLPCSGPKAEPAIKLALAHLAHWAKQEGLSLEAQGGASLPPDALLWKELLQQSLAGIYLHTVPTVPRGDLAAPTGLKLGERRYLQFQRWFEREILTDLSRFARERGGVPIRAHRVSDRKGGDASISDAMYFLTFAPFVSASKRARPAPLISGGNVQAGARQPGTSYPHLEQLIQQDRTQTPTSSGGTAEYPTAGSKSRSESAAQPVSAAKDAAMSSCPSKLPASTERATGMAPHPTDQPTTDQTSRSEVEEVAAAVDQSAVCPDPATKQHSRPPSPGPNEPKSVCPPGVPTPPSLVDVAVAYALTRRRSRGGHGNWTVAAVLLAIAVSLVGVEPRPDVIGSSLLTLITSVSDVLTGRWHVVF
jgi:hypothetical protein